MFVYVCGFFWLLSRFSFVNSFFFDFFELSNDCKCLWNVGMLFSGFLRVINVLCNLINFFSFGICDVIVLGVKLVKDLKLSLIGSLVFLLLVSLFFIVVVIFSLFLCIMVLKLFLFIVIVVCFFNGVCFVCFLKLFIIRVLSGSLILVCVFFVVGIYLILICFLGVIFFFLDILCF